MGRLLALWQDLRSSLWFVPSLIVLSAMALAAGLVELDSALGREALAGWPRLFGAGAAGSRGMLTAIATSMITVSGVAFSITVVTLSLASAQYSSRVLRNFMSDRGNQVVLGVFLGVFAYCLVVLRTIRGGDEGAFVPSLAVLTAVVLALAAVGLLIYFIHHVALSVQAAHILHAVAQETAAAIDRLFPKGMGEAAEPEHAPAAPEVARAWCPVPARRTGFVKRVDEEGLVRWAADRAAVVRMEAGIGEFVAEGAPLVSVASAGGAEAGAEAELNALFDLGRQRTVEQDAAFGFRQAVDVALKALSPGVNDVTTAILAVDYLAALLARLASRRLPSPLRLEGGALRVIARRPDFAAFVALAFDEVRRSAGGNVRVFEHLLAGLGRAGAAASPPRRAALLAQALAVREEVGRQVPAPADRAALEAAADRVAAALAAG